jgi:glycosyltransferase involved in cell wall biosynthesis
MMETLRVLHVVHSLEPGGMENGVVNIACGLSSRGIETHVACLERRGAFAGRLPDSSRVVVLGKLHGFSPLAALRLAAHLTHTRADLVHSHNLGPLIYSALATFGGTRVPLVQGEHSALTDEEKTPRRLRQRRWLYRSCARIHTVADAMRDELLAFGFAPGRITAIANGVDTSRFAPGDRVAARSALGLPADAFVIGIVGRFGPLKGHDLLIEAFELIANRFPAAHLLIAGAGGPCEEVIRTRASRSPQSARLHFTGFLDDPRRCYHALDLLAIPSINEGMSNAALEAMACGVPILANTGCGHEQFLTDGAEGRLADLHNSAVFAHELAALLSAPALLIDKGMNARRRVTGHFSLARMLDAYEQLYRATARRR